ncbi:C2H2 type zinc-finger-domain-containing protein [Scheffersomyces coipomensis]|uniref:C2H2 type zinc-finger-domain-containing protein n=1 Tax=Scheffersomyces coipomensis TaxID=1788519 RepID=UPI00315D5D30
MIFTCNTCGLNFPTAEDQRSHMKSDWHRYNLKRRVAQLPPIEEDLFNTKVASLTIDDENTIAVKPKGEKQLTKKDQRRKEKEAIQEKKRQILEVARQAMLAKMKEEGITEVTPEVTDKEVVEPTEETVEQVLPTEEASNSNEELTEEQEADKILQEKMKNKIEITPTTCLFSQPKYNKVFDTVDENIDHMFKNFGLYIPEKTYLVDKEGLIGYLGEKISFGFCIACNYQGRNAEAAREHMKQKRHMRIPYESEDEKLEISQFYDFSSTYADVPASPAAAGESDEDQWEDVSDEGEGAEDDEDDEDDLPPADQDAIYQNGLELVLPSGAVIGHRSMARYYRQNLAPERILSEGQGTVIAAETRHMLSVRDRQELATQKRVWSREKKRSDVNDRRAAKFINQQEHYRDQLLQ